MHDPVVPGITLAGHEPRRRLAHELDRPLVLEEEVVGQLADRRWPLAGVAPNGKKKLVPGIAAGSAIVPEAPLVQPPGTPWGVGWPPPGDEHFGRRS